MELKKQKKIKIKKQTVMRRIKDLGQKPLSIQSTLSTRKLFRYNDDHTLHVTIQFRGLPSCTSHIYTALKPCW